MANVKNSGDLLQKMEQAQAQAQKKEKEEPKTLKGWVQLMAPQIERALPSVITPERFSRMLLTALSNNKKLASCTKESFLAAMMQAAQLGLEPNTPMGEAYLIPYNNYKTGVLECQFQIGYKGFLKLAYRGGKTKTIQAHVFYEKDEFTCTYGPNGDLSHTPYLGAGGRGEACGVYAFYTTDDGGYAYEVMTMDEVRDFARTKSKSYNSGPWKTDFNEMAKKTVTKRLLKYAPLSTEAAQAMAADGHVLMSAQDNSTDADFSIEVVPEEEPEAVILEPGDMVKVN